LTFDAIGQVAGQAFISAFACGQVALHVAGSHLPSLHFVISHPAALHFAGSHAIAFVSVVTAPAVFGPETFAAAASGQVAADGHLPQSFDTSVAAFFAAWGEVRAFVNRITATARTTKPDKPIITFFIFIIFYKFSLAKIG
jgi:hypothetical protein